MIVGGVHTSGAIFREYVSVHGCDGVEWRQRVDVVLQILGLATFSDAPNNIDDLPALDADCWPLWFTQAYAHLNLSVRDLMLCYMIACPDKI